MMMKELIVRGETGLEVLFAGYRDGGVISEGEEFSVVSHRLSVNCVSGNGWSYNARCDISPKFPTQEIARKVMVEIVNLLWRKSP